MTVHLAKHWKPAGYVLTACTEVSPSWTDSLVKVTCRRCIGTHYYDQVSGDHRMTDPYILTDHNGACLVVYGTGDLIHLTARLEWTPTRDQAHDLAAELVRRANQEGA